MAKTALTFLLLALPLACNAQQTASWYYSKVPGYVAASWQYPIGSMLRVTEVHNGCSVVVRVIERGPARRLDRDIDLSPAAFEALDGLALGVCECRITRVSTQRTRPKSVP